MPGEINNFMTDASQQCLYVLDQTFTTKMVIDIFSDILWTERYQGYGEFEVTLPFNTDVLDHCYINDYIAIDWSNVLMIVETITTHTDPVQGDTMTISGRSLESILDRRILIDSVIGKIGTDGEPTDINVQTAVKAMISNNFISPTDQKRQIPKFSFKDSNDPNITGLVIGSFSERGAIIYDKLISICEDKGIGFRINAIDGGGFQFELYCGIDRSWDQDRTFPVTFSDSFENLLTSSYLKNIKDYKSAIYIGWDWHYTKYVFYQDAGETKYITVPTYGNEITESLRSVDSTGLLRREIYKEDDNGTYEVGSESNIPKYANQIRNKGTDLLSDHEIETMFEGDVEYARQFVYGKDYFLGDIVQLENKYGQTGKCRVTEVVFTLNASGQNLTPTFKMI